MRVLFLALATLASISIATHADAAYRCVGARFDTRCPLANVYPTIQTAVDAASPGDTVRVPARTFTERVRVTKRLKIVCDPDAVISDAGLAPGGILVEYDSNAKAYQYFDTCNLTVETSDVGLMIRHSTAGFTWRTGSITGQGRQKIGIVVDGIGSKNTTTKRWASPTAFYNLTVSGFDVGIHAEWVDYINTEPVTFVDNRIGFRARSIGGQVFQCKFYDNDTGFSLETDPDAPLSFGGADVNANDFARNGIATFLGAGFSKLEYHLFLSFGQITYDPELGQAAFAVEHCDGSIITGDLAYQQAWGQGEFGPIWVNGVQLPNSKAKRHCP